MLSLIHIYNDENPINNLKLVVNGKVEKSQNYDYQDISLRNNRNEKLDGIEYLKSNNRYGIRFNGDVYKRQGTNKSR